VTNIIIFSRRAQFRGNCSVVEFVSRATGAEIPPVRLQDKRACDSLRAEKIALIQVNLKEAKS
jgi:hypothetical protein